MESKKIYKGEELRILLKSGIQKLSDVVSSTMGPYGKNVILNSRGNKPLITKDGKNICQAFSLEDPIENLAAEFVKEASNKTEMEAGDNSSTTVLLASELFNSAEEWIKRGSNNIDIKAGILAAKDYLINQIIAQSRIVETPEELQLIAKITSNNNREISDLIYDTYKEIGLNGNINVQKTENDKTYSVIKKGFVIDKGYSDPIFINEEGKKEFRGKNGGLILLCSGGLTLNEAMPLIQKAKDDKKWLLIVGDNIDPQLITLFKMNKKELNFCIINAPGFDKHTMDIYNDCSSFIGGKIINTNMILGVAQEITIKENETILIQGAGTDEEVKERISILKSQLDPNRPRFHDIMINERISKLSGALAIIYVGGKSRIEKQETFDLIEDSVKACRSAVEEGFIPGGGYLLKSIEIYIQSDNIDFMKGVDAVRSIQECQIRKICENANLTKKEINEICNSDLVYNVKTKEFKTPIETDVLDTTKSLRCAIENSVSTISTLILSESLLN